MSTRMDDPLTHPPAEPVDVSVPERFDAGVHRWHEKYPRLGTGPVSVEPLVSKAWFEAERDYIYKKCWLHVGTVDAIPNPGDYFVHEIAIAKASIVLIRGKDHKVRGFYNVCRHRGNKLVWDYKGTSSCYLSCKFHGWVYDAEGTLKNVPDGERFYENLEGRANLVPVHTDVWEGFIFVNLDPQPTETLSEYLGAAGRRMKDFPFQRVPLQFHYQSYQRANWKLMLDAQSEIYHVRYLHSYSWPDVFTRPDNPYGHAYALDLYDRHRVGNWPGNKYFKPKDVEGLALGKSAAITTRGNEFELPTGPGINCTNADDWGFDIVHLFPNLNILILPGVWHTHQFWPISENEALWELKIHMVAPRTPSERFGQEYNKILLRDALLEDGATHEHTQDALETGAIDHVYLQDEELFVRHSYWAVEQEIRARRDGVRASLSDAADSPA